MNNNDNQQTAMLITYPWVSSMFSRESDIKKTNNVKSDLQRQAIMELFKL